jgi:hypothetical protein
MLYRNLWLIDMATAPGPCAAWPAAGPCTAGPSTAPTAPLPATAANPSCRSTAGAGRPDPTHVDPGAWSQPEPPMKRPLPRQRL